MKSVNAFIFAIVFALGIAVNVNAQSAESIWLTAGTTAFKTGETMVVTLNAASATPIQGFTFQIRYDPACLRPTNAASPVPGMNGLPLPQLTGLVDGSYASTTPQTINGVLAEVRFTTLKACQTNLMLESAALAIRNESGFAAPLAGVVLGEKNIALNIDKEVVESQSAQPVSGALLQLDTPPVEQQGMPAWLIGLLGTLAVIGGLIVMFKRLKPDGESDATPQNQGHSHTVSLQIKHGPHAGQSINLTSLPVHIGRDPMNEIRLDDPHIISQHARIFSAQNNYYLMDLGGETYINGKAVRKSSAVLKSGDVVRLGKSALFVFDT